MSVTPSANTEPLTDHPAADASLDALLRKQRALAWLLSILTLSVTVGFFCMMTLASPLMSRIAFGHSITVANVSAVCIILLFLAAIAVFGWRADRIDTCLRQEQP